MRIIAATVLVSAWLVSMAAAQAPTLKQEIVGVGAMPCGQFGKLYGRTPTDTKLTFFSWAQGYMSGVFLVGDQVLVKAGVKSKAIDLRPPGWDNDAQWQYLLRFCDQRPLAMFQDGVADLMEEITKAQPATAR